MMINCDPRDRFVDQCLTLTFMIGSISCTPMGAKTLINSNLPFEYFAFRSAILILTSFCDVLVTPLLTTKLSDVHYNKCCEECAGHVLCLSYRSTIFILYMLTRKALLKRVKKVECSIWCARMYYLCCENNTIYVAKT